MRTVLVTGATGAIGSELSRRLVTEESTRVCLLLRADSRDHLKRRLHGLFRFWNLDPDLFSTTRIEAFAGDVTQARLGLDEATWDRLSAEVTHVIHAAGNVKLNRPLPEARQAAVASVRHIVSFVDSCRRRGSFRKLDYVSTVGVGGRMPGSVPERALTEARAFRNSYEAAKAEAEVVLLQEMKENGLSATIHRPSMVVGDSATGKIIQFQVFYHLCEFLSGGRSWGVIPDIRDYRLDIVPVDYVAAAIQVCSAREDTVGRVFHLCSAEQAPTLEELAGRVRALFRARGRRTPPLRTIPSTFMRMLLPVAGWCVGANTKRALQALPFFLDYLDTPQTFTNVSSRTYLSGAGLTLPSPDGYLDAVLSYYLAGAPARTA